MKKITKKEFENLNLTKGGGLSNPVITEVLKLKIGEILFFSADEWRIKSQPSVIFYQFSMKRGIKLSTRRLMDKSGWVVTRLK